MHALKRLVNGAANTRNAIANTEVMRRALDYAATFDLTVFCTKTRLPKIAGSQQCLKFELALMQPEAANRRGCTRLLPVEQTGARAPFQGCRPVARDGVAEWRSEA